MEQTPVQHTTDRTLVEIILAVLNGRDVQRYDGEHGRASSWSVL